MRLITRRHWLAAVSPLSCTMLQILDGSAGPGTRFKPQNCKRNKKGTSIHGIR
jgi:hypothetical protein